MRLAVCCANEIDSVNLAHACEDAGVEAETVDLLADDWLARLQGAEVRGALLRPPTAYAEHKAIFDERAYFIAHALRVPTYPSFDELMTYENKRMMSTWLAFLGVDHPATRVFTTLADARAFVRSARFPLVAKSAIGSAGTAVRVLRSEWQAHRHLERVFGFGGPEMALGVPPWVPTRHGWPLPRWGRSQRHYVLLQAYVPIRFEWRLIRIGESYLGHRKLVGHHGFASGSGLVGWEPPGLRELDLLHQVSEALGFRTLALDVFATPDDRLLVNEIQPLFGSYDPAQMYVDSQPGRFLRNADGDYRFDPGEHCRHGSWALRVEDFLHRLSQTPAASAPGVTPSRASTA